MYQIKLSPVKYHVESLRRKFSCFHFLWHPWVPTLFWSLLSHIFYRQPYFTSLIFIKNYWKGCSWLNTTIFEFKQNFEQILIFFRKSYSTNIWQLTDKGATRFEKDLITGMILIDLQKAFDTFDHLILLNKIKYLGFSRIAIALFKSYVIELFKSYLIERKF